MKLIAAMVFGILTSSMALTVLFSIRLLNVTCIDCSNPQAPILVRNAVLHRLSSNDTTDTGTTKRVSVAAGRRGEPINPFIYGQFIEHMGKCINGGIWAEMLEDRKFFMPVGTEGSPWRIIGPAGAVCMTKDHSFVNGHAPLVAMMGGEAGLVQGELAVAKGKRYVGRIWLAGAVEAGPVEVRLVWGDAPEARESVRIAPLAPEYRKYPLEFTADADTTAARLEIIGRERGNFRVGPVSLMPADNVKGMRPDVLALVKELKSPIYRWPGGTFATIYEWRDGIGDPDRRPTRENFAWGGLEPNDFGFHEFMDFCREVGDRATGNCKHWIRGSAQRRGMGRVRQRFSGDADGRLRRSKWLARAFPGEVLVHR